MARQVLVTTFFYLVGVVGWGTGRDPVESRTGRWARASEMTSGTTLGYHHVDSLIRSFIH